MKTVSEMLTALRAKLGQKKLQERISDEVVADPKALRMEAARRLYVKEFEEPQLDAAVKKFLGFLVTFTKEAVLNSEEIPPAIHYSDGTQRALLVIPQFAEKEMKAQIAPLIADPFSTAVHAKIPFTPTMACFISEAWTIVRKVDEIDQMEEPAKAKDRQEIVVFVLHVRGRNPVCAHLPILPGRLTGELEMMDGGHLSGRIIGGNENVG